MLCAADNVKKATTRVAETMLPTKFGMFRCIVYRFEDQAEHLALVKGEVRNKRDVLVRIQSECLTSEVLSSLKCDCKGQLDEAMSLVNQNGGVILYLRQEGRGIGLSNKIKAYQLQEKGVDTVDANRLLGLPDDGRDFHCAADILKDLGLGSVKLLTNNPAKLQALQELGIVVEGRMPLQVAVDPHAAFYLHTKRTRMGHLLEI